MTSKYLLAELDEACEAVFADLPGRSKWTEGRTFLEGACFLEQGVLGMYDDDHLPRGIVDDGEEGDTRDTRAEPVVMAGVNL